MAEAAERDLLRIHDLYFELSPSTANKLVNRIVARTRLLGQQFPKQRQQEPQFRFHEEDCYVVVGNFKIVYRYIRAGILINAVFDTRQESSKLNKRFK